MKSPLLACLTLALAGPALALYDPPPAPEIAIVEGEWTGTLRYRDYQTPDRFETLPTRTTIALSAPDTLSLHAVYDDGPGKTVHSYEQMRFDLKTNRLDWRYGLKADDRGGYDIVANEQDGDCRRFVVEHRDGGAKASKRYDIALCANRIEIVKFEIDAEGAALERSRTALSRASMASAAR